MQKTRLTHAKLTNVYNVQLAKTELCGCMEQLEDPTFSGLVGKLDKSRVVLP